MKLVQLIKWILRETYLWNTIGSFFVSLHRVSLIFAKNHDKPLNQFVIFGQWRSWSTLLVNLLNSCDSVYCANELLRYRIVWPINYVEMVSRRSVKSIFWFKLLTHHLKDIYTQDTDDNLLLQFANKWYKILYLKRNNVLLHALSNIQARTNNQFHSSGWRKISRLTIDESTLFHRIAHYEQLELFEESVLSQTKHHKVLYEKDLLDPSNHQMVIDKIMNYIWSDDKCNIWNVDNKKIVSKNLRETIENYDEFVWFIKWTKYEKYLPKNTNE